MTDCYCDDGPAPDFYFKTEPKAKKEHVCDECGRAVRPGEKYERVRASWEGDPTVYRTCCRCLALREWVKAHVPCFCWYHGNMIQDAMDEAQNTGDQAPGMLFGAYRRLVAIRAAKRVLSSTTQERK